MSETTMVAVSDQADLVMRQRADGSVASVQLPGGIGFGWQADELGEMSLPQLLHPEDRIVAHRGRSWCLATGTPQVVNVRIRTPGGRWQWYEADIARVVLTDGSMGTATTLRDISEMAMTQETLSLVIGLRNYIDTASDVEDALQQTAVRVARFLNFDRAYVWSLHDGQPIAASSVGDVAAPVSFDAELDAHLQGVFDSGVAVQPSGARESRDPRARAESPVHVIAVPVVARGETIAVVEFESGSPIVGSSVLALIGDVFDQLAEAIRRKGVDVELEIARQQLSLAFSEAPIAMAFMTLDGDFVRVNRAVSALLERTLDDLLHIRLQDVIFADDVGVGLAGLDEVLAGERDRSQMETRFVRPDGSLVWVLLSVSVVRDRSGEPLHFIAQLVDISAQKAREFQLANRDARRAQPSDSARVVEGLDAFLQSQSALGLPTGVIDVRLAGVGEDGEASVIELALARLQAATRSDDFFVRLDPSRALVVVSALADEPGETGRQLRLVVDRIESNLVRAVQDQPTIHVVVSGRMLEADGERAAQLLSTPTG